MNRLIGIVIILFLTEWATVSYSQETLQRFEFSHRSMGTLFRIICYADNSSMVMQVKEKAFELIDSLNYAMSDYLPDSELNRLSRSSASGAYVRVSEDLFTVIHLGKSWAERTDGIFDITIGPYSQLWRRAGRQDVVPSREKIEEASERVGYEYVLLDTMRQAVNLSHKDMQLDLGGIAKGYAVDKVYNLFKHAGIYRVLIDGGGDIRAGEPPPGKDCWRIVLENLEDDNKVVGISNTSIATSGDLYRYFLIDNVKYGHIIDPRTGYGVTTPRTVTILTTNCTEADVLASVVSILGPEEGFKLLSELSEVTALIVQEEEGGINRYQLGTLEYLK